MKVSAQKLPQLLSKVLGAGITPFIHGSPSIGKSDIVRQVADKYNLQLIDLRLSQTDSVDMQGLPYFNADHTKAGYVPMDTFPIKGDPLPKDKEGWLLFLDEMNSAPLSVQAAAFKLVLDKQVGKFDLHSKVAIVCAGNLATDKAIVNRLSTPMQSRLAHFELRPDIKSWITWADKHDVDYRIKAYLNYKPEMLYMFDPKHNNYTFPSPRTWSFASKLINHKELDEDSVLLLGSVINEGAAREFFSYTKIFNELASIEQILDDPERVKVSKEPSIQYATQGLLSHHINRSNAGKLMKYAVRLPIEFQVLLVRAVIAKDPNMLQENSIVDWKTDHLYELLS